VNEINQSINIRLREACQNAGQSERITS